MISEKTRRFVFTIVLATFLMSYLGCASYRDAAVPSSEVQGGGGALNDVVVEGDSVRLRLYSGESYSGEVMWVTTEKLRLGGLGNYGLSDLTIQLVEIERLELRNQSSDQLEGTWFLGIGIGLIGWFIWGLSQLNNSFGN